MHVWCGVAPPSSHAQVSLHGQSAEGLLQNPEWTSPTSSETITTTNEETQKYSNGRRPPTARTFVLSLQFSFPTSLNTGSEARTSGSAHKLPRATRHHQEQPEGTINPNMPCAHLIALYLRAAE